MKAKAHMLAREAESQTVKFKSTEATKQAARTIALDLGESILKSIAIGLGSLPEPRFDTKGVTTCRSNFASVKLAVNGLKMWLMVAVNEDRVDRDVVNQIRENAGLAPIL